MRQKSPTPTPPDTSSGHATEQTPLLQAEPDLTTFPTLSESEPTTPARYSIFRPFTRTPSPYLIIPPLFIHLFSMSLATAPTQQFFLLYMCGVLHPPEGGAVGATSFLAGLFGRHGGQMQLPRFDQCLDLDDVQVLTARWTLILSLATTIPAVLSVPFYGVLLDRVGRKPVLLIPIVSAMLGLFALISVAKLGAGLWVLLLSNFLSGCMGSFAVMVMAIFAYIADTTTQSQRTHTFVYVEASLFIALTAGPFCGGVLSRTMPQGVIGVFYIALVGKVLAFLYVAFLLPESFNPSPQIPAPASASNPNDAKLHGTFAEMKESLRGSLKLFSVAGPTGKATRIMLVIFFVIASAFGQFSVFFYYMVKMFKWDAYEEGVFMLVLSVARTCWMVGFFPWLMKRLINGVVPHDGPEQRERRVKVELIILRIALLVLVVGYLALGLATEDWMIYAITIADGFGTVTKPTLRGLLSRTVPAELQGRLFSGTQMVEQIGTLISGVVYPSLWASTVTKLPNGFFFLTSALYAVGFIMAVWLRSDGLYGLEHEIAPKAQDAATENDVLGAVVDEGEETGAI